MPTKPLHLEPYSGLWIDCINNNLLGILLPRNPSFSYMTLNLRRNYSICRIKQADTLTDDMIEKAIAPGLCVLDVHIEHPQYGDAVLYEGFQTTSKTDIHALIRSCIDASKYIFIKLDRFYIPYSKNDNKTHFANMALIYGYDDLEQKYKVINDHRITRTYERFELSFETVNHAFHESTDPDRVLFSVEISDASNRIDYKISTNKLIDNLQSLLDTRIQRETIQNIQIESIEIERQFGLSCLLEYAHHITEYLPLVHVDFLPAVYNTPLDFQRSNLLIIDALEQAKLLPAIDILHLKQKYTELKRVWEIYRNKIYMFIGRRQLMVETEQDVIGIQQLLLEIYRKEKEATEFFLKTLQTKRRDSLDSSI